MQLFEAVFFLIVFSFILRLLVPKLRQLLLPKYFVLVGLVSLVLLLVINGARWQILPALVAFTLLAMGALKRSQAKTFWRIFAAIPLIILLAISIALTLLLPVFKLPIPSGQFSVGTFGYNLVDLARAERFNPTENRELSVRVWYPSQVQDLNQYQVRTLWEDLYRGDFDLVKFFTSHFRLIDTNSLVNAPIAEGEHFPILIFNHGMMSTPEQNTILIEHLASHGYVILSIARTYQSTKVFLESSEKVLFTTQLPADLEIEGAESRSTAGVRDLAAFAPDGTVHSQLDEQLFNLFDSFRLIENEGEKMQFVSAVLDDRENYLIGDRATPENLYNYFDGRMTAMGSIAQTWVKDIQITIDEIENVEAPIPGFIEAIDSDNLGVFGHSFGSVAAGEFCKLDERCDAGIHIDGNQQGYNWSKPLLAPFLVMYSANFYLGNEFAYKNSDFDFWNMTIDEIDHLDYTDIGLAVRGVSGPGFMGDVNNQRALQIVNDVALSFFDHYLKGKPMRSDLLEIHPELTLELRD